MERLNRLVEPFLIWKRILANRCADCGIPVSTPTKVICTGCQEARGKRIPARPE